MIDKLLQNSLLLVLYGLAIFYLVEIISDFSINVYIKTGKGSSVNGLWKYFPSELGRDFNKTYLLDFKPFNCILCMSGWLSILVYLLNVDIIYLFPFSLAGIALLLSKIKNRLETFVA